MARTIEQREAAKVVRHTVLYKLRAAGQVVPRRYSDRDLCQLIQRVTNWEPPASTFSAYMTRYAQSWSVAVVPARERKPLRTRAYQLSPMLKHAAARAVCQPRLIPAVSRIDNWRDLGSGRAAALSCRSCAIRPGVPEAVW